MGQIAEDMVSGLCCSECGVYFEDAHGSPVYCDTCWELNEADNELQPGVGHATIREIEATAD